MLFYYYLIPPIVFFVNITHSANCYPSHESLYDARGTHDVFSIMEIYPFEPILSLLENKHTLKTRVLMKRKQSKKYEL